MEPFKNIYNQVSIKKISNLLKINAGQKFNQVGFDKAVMQNLEALELKARVEQITINIHEHLKTDYKHQVQVLIQSLAAESEIEQMNVSSIHAQTGLSGFLVWPLVHFVALYGLEDFETSFKAMEEMTKRFSAEFTIRPFIDKNPKLSFKYISQWKNHSNKHLRRLASEGIRPLLPWGKKVEYLTHNLEEIKNILETIKDDPELYVRKSVANNLNDFSKIDKKLFFKIIMDWKKNSNPHRNWIIRHATRSLLKKADPVALKIHGYNTQARLEIKKLSISKKKIKLGESVELDLKIKNCESKKNKVLIEYVIYFLKNSGKHNPKPFRLTDRILTANELFEIKKTISFKEVTTRKFYSGEHFISIHVNGQPSKKIRLEVF